MRAVYVVSMLIPGTLLRRYKRFLADVMLDSGEEVTAHCPNPGSMMGLKEPGMRVWLSRSDNPKRKLRYGWELAELPDGTRAGINTNKPNTIVAEALARDAIPELSGYDTHRREVRYGTKSRVDFLLTGAGRRDCWLEIKNVHLLRRPGLAEFPDSVTARAARHMGDLADQARAGDRAAVLFVIQMTGIERFALARDLDPGYARAFDAAMAAGVEAMAWTCTFAEPPDTQITLDRRVPLVDTATLQENKAP